MNGIDQEFPLNKKARISGALYLAMAPFAGFSLFVNFSNFVQSSAQQTTHNIHAAEGLYRLGIVTWLVSQFIFILLAFSLFHLLKNVSKASASLMVIFAFIGISLAFSNEIFQFAILRLLSGGTYLEAFSQEQINGLVVLVAHVHNHGIQVAHIFWGVWLFPLAHLIYRSGFLPKFIAVLILIAGCGYLIDFLINVFLPDSGLTVTQFTFIGELVFPLWLLIKGVKRVEKGSDLTRA
jgi:hypothetical protein